ncbi:MAG: EAL domain-containing protein [Pseudomonadota bacterium]
MESKGKDPGCLRDSQVADVVYQIIRDGVALADANHRIVEVTQAFRDITGYDDAELVGRSPLMLGSPHNDPGQFQSLEESLHLTGCWQGEVLNRRKNGEEYAALLRIQARYGPEHELLGYVAVLTDIHVLKHVQEQLAYLDSYDGLTGLPNRRMLGDGLHQAVERARRDNRLLGVVYLDLDGFKAINDHYGHATGDTLLVMIAQSLRELVDGDGLVARMGGDEFALVLEGLNNMDELESMARRILVMAGSSFDIDGHKHHLSASLGVTIFPMDGADPETLLRHADQAMYQAKQAGRNRFHLFDARQDQLALSRRQMRERMLDGLINGEFELFYQPKVNLRSGVVIGAEGLLRWRHPERGLLLPGEFLPPVEHDDLIIDIGEWVIRTALAQIRTWRTLGLELSISVNIAARQLQRPDFIDCMERCLADFPDTPDGRLELEILESAALENTAHVRQVISTCQRLGVGFALDDFGTGYASLSYLRDIPADVLKIDQCFVRDVLDDSDDLTLIDGIISLANAFRRIVVAEGVETPEQGVLLMRLGCDIAQGYGIARPMPASAMPDWVAGYKPDPQWSLWADTPWEMADFPLLVAQYDHIKWVKQIALYVEGGNLQMSDHEIVDHHQCRFGHWYYSHGNLRYGHLVAFRQLEDIHARVHRVGSEIVGLRAVNRQDDARHALATLLGLKDEVLLRLANLQKAVVASAAPPLLGGTPR